MGCLDNHVASMGPRLVSRGKTIGGIGYRFENKLQWGRDLLVAESKSVKGGGKAGETWLQWGRDLLVAESPFQHLIPSQGA